MLVHLADRERRPLCSHQDSRLHHYITGSHWGDVTCVSCGTLVRNELEDAETEWFRWDWTLQAYVSNSLHEYKVYETVTELAECPQCGCPFHPTEWRTRHGEEGAWWHEDCCYGNGPCSEGVDH